jgi:hypothetical protein
MCTSDIINVGTLARSTAAAMKASSSTIGAAAGGTVRTGVLISRRP